MARRSFWIWPLIALGLAVARPAAAQDAGAVLPCATGADREPVETRCDGIDNDCDGLVDVLMPTAANACAPADGLSCGTGHAACVDGQRVCLAPGPSPEVLDGQDNDCDGVVDNVPSAPLPAARARALLLVPPYAFTDAPLEVDQIASVLDQWGIAYDRPSSPADFDASLPLLPQYPLVIIPGYLEEDFLVPFRQAALESYAQQGGVLVVFKPALADGSPTNQLIGTRSAVRRTDIDGIAFDGPRTGATRAFDSPEELRVPINAPASGETLWVHVLTPADAQTQALATGTAGGVPVGPVLTRRTAGAGAVYAMGHDLHTSLAERCYINCFEPAGDLAGLFLREAFREGMRGHVVLKHTVPGPEDSVAIFSHDLCAYDAQQPDPAWGEPGALQVAEIEQRWGARGSFFVPTQNVTTAQDIPYYSPALMQALCGLGMCPVGAHSVVHGLDFGRLPLGTCDERPDSYDPVTNPTLCGEIRVSLQAVGADSGLAPIAWRSPYLAVNPQQFDVLAAQGVLLDASYSVGDLKSNLPVSLAHTGMNQLIFHHQPLYSLPIALEDGLGSSVDGIEQREEMGAANAALFRSRWTYALLRNADNGAHTLSLLHPSYGLNQPRDNVRNKLEVLDSVLQAARARQVRIDTTAAELAVFWQAREETAVDAAYLAGAPARYQGTIRTGVHGLPELTLEFGDRIGGFTCAGCGTPQISGKRITLHGTLPAASTFTFQATVDTGAPAVPAVPARYALLLATALLLMGLRRRGHLAAAAATAAILCGGTPARGEPNPYCTMALERAADDAALLLSPRVVLEGLRFPYNGTLEGGAVLGQGYQARAGLAFSATDLYKGLGLRHVADADCRVHEARAALDGTLRAGDDAARQAGFEAQAAFLEQHRADVRQIIDHADARFAAHAITVIELQDIRARAVALDRALEQAHGQSTQLRLNDTAPVTTPGKAQQLAQVYAEASADYDRAATRVRRANAWQLEVTAGIIPGQRLDWYGTVRLGLNIGGLARLGHDIRYARAHQDEIATAPDEPAARLGQQRRLLSAARDQAKVDLALVDRELNVVQSTARVLEGTEEPNAVHQRERLALDQVGLEAQRVFQTAYLAGLERLLQSE